MSTRRRLAERLGLAVTLLAVFATNGFAHRLDEYLQATRIAIEPDRILLDLDLTPGAEVADGIFEVIDRDHDGKLSVIERTKYTQAVVNSLFLAIDGRTYVLSIQNARFPTLDEMRLGEGVIRLRATALLAGVEHGQHRLMFTNGHRADIGVYLVNALVPDGDRIHITGQFRDALQREFVLSYSFSGVQSTAAIPILLSAAMATALLAFARRRPDA
jgi:hypothetical protein